LTSRSRSITGTVNSRSAAASRGSDGNVVSSARTGRTKPSGSTSSKSTGRLVARSIIAQDVVARRMRSPRASEISKSRVANGEARLDGQVETVSSSPWTGLRASSRW
jgi:hypothetical protein